MDENLNLNENLEIEKALKEFEAKQDSEQTQKASEVSKNSEIPRIVQLVIKWSGGAIKEEKQAEYILFGFVVVAIVISLFLVLGEKDQKYRCRPLLRHFKMINFSIKKNNFQKSGFTLIELLVVVAIIGILSSVILTSLNNARAKARNSKRMLEIHTVELALDLYLLNNGTYPTPDYDGCGGWDIGNKDYIFLNGKMPGILPNAPRDLTKSGNCDGYFYYLYPAGYSSCPASWGNFYILGTYLEPNVTNPAMVLPAPCSDWWSNFGYGKYKFENH